MFLTDIEAVLQAVDPHVDYGMADKEHMETVWNYIVFNRTGVNYSASKTGASDKFDVHIIRENYVPEGLDEEIVTKLCELPGVRISGDAEINYAQKPGTNIVIEILTIHFVRARKR